MAKSNSVLVKIAGAGQEGDLGPGARRFDRAQIGERRLGLAVAEAQGIFVPAAPDAQIEHGGQRIHHRHADAVQPARHLVGVLVELAAGMQPGHDDLGGRDAFFGMDVDGNAAAVVAHRAGAVGVERHAHRVAIAGERLVDGVVDDLVDHVMQARAVVGVADIHARALAHGIEPAQHLDRMCVVFLGFGCRKRFGHIFADLLKMRSPHRRP